MSAEHPNVAMLRELYEDLSRIGEFVDDEVVLHAAEREIPGMQPRHDGRQSVQDRERNLIRITEDTLIVDVDQIIANDHFGAVTGTLRARLDGAAITMPFCGLWRFRNGRIVEHWENVYDIRAFVSASHDSAGHSPRPVPHTTAFARLDPSTRSFSD